MADMPASLIGGPRSLAFRLDTIPSSGLFPTPAGVMQSAADTPMSPDEEEALRMHGFGASALGEECPTWLKKFAAMQVR